MKTYKAKSDFWHAGTLIHSGTIVKMTSAQAKYLGHVLVDEALVAKQPEPKAEVVAEKPKAEKPADGSK